MNRKRIQITMVDHGKAKLHKDFINFDRVNEHWNARILIFQFCHQKLLIKGCNLLIMVEINQLIRSHLHVYDHLMLQHL